MRSLSKRFADVSIARKLYFTVGIMALLIGIELFALFFSISTLSSIRAYVGGEGLWSKAQKDAVYQLHLYGSTRKEDYYIHFKEYLKVPLGDGMARREMEKEHMDMAVIRQGFMNGGIHPDDIDGMVKLVRRFNSNPYIQRAIEAWHNAEASLTELIRIGEELHMQINAPVPSSDSIQRLLARIEPINEGITAKEDAFSYAFGEGSRWLEHFVLKMLFAVALTVEISGLLLAIYVNRGIQRSLKSILQAARSFARGNLDGRAHIYSNDEIGMVATAYNNMAKKLQDRIYEIELKNRESQQLAYMASHDLQEPLRTVNSFIELLKIEFGDKMDPQEIQYLDFIAEASGRMQNLTRALLDYSRIGRDKQVEMVNCNDVVRDVLTDIRVLLTEKRVEIHVQESLPTLPGYPVELKMLFQNLILNAIKFQPSGNIPVIHIGCREMPPGWEFSVKDNGIGIPVEYQEKIFVIFQRLHPRNEYDGTGIGLAHCTKIATLHNGTIWVESVANEGSCFYFTIQLTRPV